MAKSIKFEHNFRDFWFMGALICFRAMFYVFGILWALTFVSYLKGVNELYLSMMRFHEHQFFLYILSFHSDFLPRISEIQVYLLSSETIPIFSGRLDCHFYSPAFFIASIAPQSSLLGMTAVALKQEWINWKFHFDHTTFFCVNKKLECHFCSLKSRWKMCISDVECPPQLIGSIDVSDESYGIQNDKIKEKL